MIALVAASYVSAYAESPITLREATVNSRGRIALEQGLANVLAQIPSSATLLMYEAEHAGALRLAGIPLRHVISEAEHPDWEWAQLDPANRVDYVVACQGDPVWAAVRHHEAEFTAGGFDQRARPIDLHSLQTQVGDASEMSGILRG